MDEINYCKNRVYDSLESLAIVLKSAEVTVAVLLMS